jgi:4-hydroxythreonine-4-phosphate dehydrogenase
MTKLATATEPLIGISLGDPAGIGPEIVARALAERPQLRLRVYGDPHLVESAARAQGIAPPAPGRIQAVAGGTVRPGEIVPGQPGPASARAQLAYLEAATAAALAGDIDALCTAPISKEWIARAGFMFPGHTEYLAHRSGTRDFAMMLAGPRLKVVLATTHIALRDVPDVLTAESIAAAAVLAARALVADFGVARARVAVAGLNPHAGEAGRFGDEETRLVTPAVALAARRLDDAAVPARISGPHPPDAVFRQAAEGAYDAVVALYHDQGLIPVKVLHFDEAVNLTLGLPFVRTSPDHGTAYDMAGTGRARATSLLAALDMAARLATARAGSGRETRA